MSPKGSQVLVVTIVAAFLLGVTLTTAADRFMSKPAPPEPVGVQPVVEQGEVIQNQEEEAETVNKQEEQELVIHGRLGEVPARKIHIGKPTQGLGEFSMTEEFFSDLKEQRDCDLFSEEGYQFWGVGEGVKDGVTRCSVVVWEPFTFITLTGIGSGYESLPYLYSGIIFLTENDAYTFFPQSGFGNIAEANAYHKASDIYGTPDFGPDTNWGKMHDMYRGILTAYLKESEGEAAMAHENLSYIIRDNLARLSSQTGLPLETASYTDEQICSLPPMLTDIGSLVHPKFTRYEFAYLGDLFTASECQNKDLEEVFGVEDGMYTLGGEITLIDYPSPELAEVLEEIGFTCGELGEAPRCHDWILKDASVPVEDLLKLKPYVDEIKAVSCRNCG